jgi:hypothetical protein
MSLRKEEALCLYFTPVESPLSCMPILICTSCSGMEQKRRASPGRCTTYSPLEVISPKMSNREQICRLKGWFNQL